MKVNPHELINLRGYGNAEKELRKAGKWKFEPQERYAKIIDDLGYALAQASGSIGDAEDRLRDLETAMEATT